MEKNRHQSAIGTRYIRKEPAVPPNKMAFIRIEIMGTSAKHHAAQSEMSSLFEFSVRRTLKRALGGNAF